jgi:hypothetical protein
MGLVISSCESRSEGGINLVVRVAVTTYSTPLSYATTLGT